MPCRASMICASARRGPTRDSKFAPDRPGSTCSPTARSLVADRSSGAFITVRCTDDRGRQHEYYLADATVALEIGEGPRKGEQVSLRQVSLREPAPRGRHLAGAHPDLPHRPARRRGVLADELPVVAGELLPLRPYHLALDALDCHAAAPMTPADWCLTGEEGRRGAGLPGRGCRRRGLD